MSESPAKHQTDPDQVQLHLVLPYKFEPRSHNEVRELLERGYTISQLQRVSDREALVTLVRGQVS